MQRRLAEDPRQPSINRWAWPWPAVARSSKMVDLLLRNDGPGKLSPTASCHHPPIVERSVPRGTWAAIAVSNQQQTYSTKSNL